MIEFTHNYIEPHQVNSFVYCKRKWYYQNRLKFPIINDHIEIGKYIHEHHFKKVLKYKEVYLISNKWKLKGICDFLTKENNMQIPIEIKKGKCNRDKPFENDIMQLMCYILLLEDHFKVIYTYGYILYVGSRRKYEVKVTLLLRRTIQNYFNKINSYLRSGRTPKHQSERKLCKKCSYNDYCWCE